MPSPRRLLVPQGFFVLWGFVAVGAVVAATLTIAATQTPSTAATGSEQPTALPVRHTVTILGALSAPGIPTGEFDRLGAPVLANCTTCHATREPNRATNDGAQLKDFHQGLTTAHGGLQCIACHNPDNYSQLRLASGDAIEFGDSLRLCAQCHGPQYRDYLKGAHGGMTGHWDLAQGPRVRNHCLACHDAHAPQYQQVMPVFAPHRPSGAQTPAAGHP